jgi:hypothetical protein
VTSLFIGVVSYEGSRFAVSQGPAGLGARLARSLRETTIDTTLVVRTEDAHDEAVLPLTPSVVRESLREKLRVERSWQRFLREGAHESTLDRLQREGALAYWRAHQEATVLAPWKQHLASDSRATRSVRRLVNIELSHVALLRGAVEAGADWTLILEDDASAPDLDDCVMGLRGLLSEGGPQPAYVNVSQSHSFAELGVAHLITGEAATWQGVRERRILRTSRPVTNTVCAILYRNEFVVRLLTEFDAMPMTPVVPIDWKLNLALMGLYRAGALPEGSCWIVDPAPIDQMSMR